MHNHAPGILRAAFLDEGGCSLEVTIAQEVLGFGVRGPQDTYGVEVPAEELAQPGLLLVRRRGLVVLGDGG